MLLVALFALAVFAALWAEALSSPNLLSWDAGSPSGGWRRWFPRKEVSPYLEEQAGSDGQGELLSSGSGLDYCIGGWERDVKALSEGRAFHLYADVECREVANPLGSLWIRVYWQGDLPEGTAPEVVAVTNAGSGCMVFDDRIVVPKGANAALVRLIYRWDPRGRATWRGISMSPAGPEPAHRIVRVSTVYWRPKGQTTVENNISNFVRMLDKAAESRPDFVCLSEGIAAIGVGLGDLGAVSETLPGGRFFTRIAERAAAHRMHVIYGTYERDGAYVFNTAVLVGRDGEMIGKYRKTVLPLEEDSAGLAPGNSIPVFDTDLCRVGMAVCFDTEFPEVMRCAALEGAEIIFVPIWGGDEGVVRARARENGVYVVTASYDMKCVVLDRLGMILAHVEGGVKDGVDEGVATASCDVDYHPRTPWNGDFPSYMKRLRAGDTFGRLARPVE